MSSPSLASPAGRRIDPRGHRFGAGLSVVILALGFATGSPLGLYGLRWYAPRLFDRLVG